MKRLLHLWVAFLAGLFLTLFSGLPLQAQGYFGGYPGRGQGSWGQRPGGAQQGYGTQDRGNITGRVWFLPEEEKGSAPKDSTKASKEIPGAGTVVIVVTSKKDTLFTTVTESGRFRFFNVPTGTAQVRFTMIGYAEEGHPMDITPGENKVVAYLRPESYQLEAAVKKADVPPVAVDKDTIIFRAAAVKINKGEMAIDILSQMPGVEVTESSATVLNEEVKRVYVDGALLFGEAPMSALNNLPAEEVIDIRPIRNTPTRTRTTRSARTKKKNASSTSGPRANPSSSSTATSWPAAVSTRTAPTINSATLPAWTCMPIRKSSRPASAPTSTTSTTPPTGGGATPSAVWAEAAVRTCATSRCPRVSTRDG